MDIEKEKEKLRHEMKRQLKALSAEDRDSRSRQVALKLRKDAKFQGAKAILFYLSTSEEVDTRPLVSEILKAGKTVLVSSIDQNSKEMSACVISDLEKDLMPGSYGILEPRPEKRKPVSNDTIDVVLVPALAYDQANNRLGRSGGYYDRFLAKLPKKTATYGLAFNFQIIKSLPVTELDVPVGRVFHD